MLRPAALAALLSLALVACGDDSSSSRSEGAGGASGSSGGAGSGGGAEAGAQGFPAETEACEEPGAIDCPGDPAGTPATYSLRCVSGTWALHETCGTGKYCDTHEGPDRGRCAPPFAPCAGAKAGALVCEERDIYRCGPEPLAFAKVAACPKGCLAGACTCGGTGEACTPEGGGKGVCTNKGVCVGTTGD